MRGTRAPAQQRSATRGAYLPTNDLLFLSAFFLFHGYAGFGHLPVSLIGADTHGTPKSLLLPMGPVAPGIGARSLHQAAAGYVLDFHHPLPRPCRRCDLSHRGRTSRYWASGAVV